MVVTKILFPTLNMAVVTDATSNLFVDSVTAAANGCAPVAAEAGLIVATATVHVTAQCAYPLTDVSHVHFDSALQAVAPVRTEHVGQSPASPHGCLVVVREIKQCPLLASLPVNEGDTTMAVPATLVTV
jgi:hypothetical protein